MSSHSDTSIMDTNKPSQPVTPNKPSPKPSLVPLGVTIGLAVFALILSVAGYGFRLMAGEPLSDVAFHAMKLVPAFVIGIPALFWIGAQAMNAFMAKHKRNPIHTRNALTLGWLISCVTMLWLMGTYS